MECLVYKFVKGVGLSDKKIKSVVNFVLQNINRTDSLVSVSLVGDKKIRSLNKFYRDKDMVTDVLSFATGDGKLKLTETDLGDIFICIPQIKRQAKKNNISIKEELTRMLVHGVLHLAGFDHIKKSPAKIMFDLQERLVKEIL